ncbi:hypothetical protein PG994_009815 [Apiospora phragmitis]|uniref:Serine hydrolase domain-containing protein n=1 Tax=Apiospora phragmitis TaxID=2905665 RepID=A0ABR1U756_9PEZI
MKFLCLPGAYGSADKFQIQLGMIVHKFIRPPLVKELMSDDTASFRFIDAPCEAVPPKGFADFFGNPPYYRFIEPDDKDTAETDVLSRIRDFPECDTAEDTMRELMREGIGSSVLSTDRAIQFLFDIMEREGPFEGIIGYSEGATVAGTLLLHEQRRREKAGRKPQIKCAVFFAGWPPLDPVVYKMVLSDESDLMIDIHTCHISDRFFGSLRFGIDGALQHVRPGYSLHIRSRQGAYLAAGKGVVKELGDVIRNMIAEVSS